VLGVEAVTALRKAVKQGEIRVEIFKPSRHGSVGSKNVLVLVDVKNAEARKLRHRVLKPGSEVVSGRLAYTRAGLFLLSRLCGEVLVESVVFS